MLQIRVFHLVDTDIIVEINRKLSDLQRGRSWTKLRLSGLLAWQNQLTSVVHCCVSS